MNTREVHYQNRYEFQEHSCRLPHYVYWPKVTFEHTKLLTAWASSSRELQGMSPRTSPQPPEARKEWVRDGALGCGRLRTMYEVTRPRKVHKTGWRDLRGQESGEYLRELKARE